MDPRQRALVVVHSMISELEKIAGPGTQMFVKNVAHAPTAGLETLGQYLHTAQAQANRQLQQSRNAVQSNLGVGGWFRAKVLRRPQAIMDRAAFAEHQAAHSSRMAELSGYQQQVQQDYARRMQLARQAAAGGDDAGHAAMRQLQQVDFKPPPGRVVTKEQVGKAYDTGTRARDQGRGLRIAKNLAVAGTATAGTGALLYGGAKLRNRAQDQQYGGY